jgi:hypothetical protein
MSRTESFQGGIEYRGDVMAIESVMVGFFQGEVMLVHTDGVDDTRNMRRAYQARVRRKNMNPARIRKLAEAASNLSNTNNYEAAFTLRWVAYEGLMLRAAIKALWIRGAKVKEAENIITTLPHRDPLTMLAACCGQSINLTTDQYPILKRIKDRAHFRNILFHQLNVASKKQLQLLSDILGFTLANPKMAFGNLAVRASEMNSAMRLGDPLVDLRKLKRIPQIRVKPVAKLFRYDERDRQPPPAIPDLTKDEVLRLFMPLADSVAVRVERNKPRLTAEEIRKRMAAWKASLNKSNVAAA